MLMIRRSCLWRSIYFTYNLTCRFEHNSKGKFCFCASFFHFCDRLMN